MMIMESLLCFSDDFRKTNAIFRSELIYLKALLYAINGGIDELTKVQVTPEMPKVEGEYLDFDDVWNKFDKMMDWLVKLTSKH